MYEHHSDSLLPYEQWLKRVLLHAQIAVLIIICALGLGIAGYHYLGHLNMVDSLLEASMILGGMGPVATMNNDAVKIFASIYALFSGLIVLSASGIIVAPWLHRLLHTMHQKPKTARER